MTLLEKLQNELSSNVLHVHEKIKDFQYKTASPSNFNSQGMVLIGVCHDIEHKYDSHDCALVYNCKKDHKNHWIHIPTNLLDTLLKNERSKGFDS